MGRNIEFFYDYGSPAAYLAWTQLPNIADRCHSELIYRPMLLGGVFKATGNQSPAQIKAKGDWMGADLRRWAERYSVPYISNPYFPIITLSHMRGAIAAQISGPERLKIMNKAMFTAIWVDQKNMNDAAVISEVLRIAGLEPNEFMETISHQEVKNKLIANTEEAVARGVFGAPTMFVNDKLFWGQDRLDFVEQEATET